MRGLVLWTAMAGGLVAMTACSATAQTWESPGSLVGVSVEVEGRAAPLYAAADGSGRFYVEARAGAGYSIKVVSRSYERLGVLVAVDGLNVVSGERCPDLSSRPSGQGGRLYVLDPWSEATIRGWRTSLDEVRRFNFVDERVSYASRAGKSNSKMGWIEVAVFRERRPLPPPPPIVSEAPPQPYDDEVRDKALDKDEPQRRADAGEAKGRMQAPQASAAPGGGSYPGTGWGSRLGDRVTLVDFEPQDTPAERQTLRYEYRSALFALGVLPRPYPSRDRLSERDNGQGGFSRPPAW